MESFESIDLSTVTDLQVLNIKRAEIRARGMGYTREENRPDSTAQIEITGKPNTGTVTRFINLFYPVDDTRLINPFFNADRTTLTVTQTLATLPGWIAALTAIPVNEANVVSYYSDRDRYEFQCLRMLTNK